MTHIDDLDIRVHHRSQMEAAGLQQIVEHIGGENSLAQFSTLLHSDAGEGILGKLSGLAGGLFGKA